MISEKGKRKKVGGVDWEIIISELEKKKVMRSPSNIKIV